MVRNVRGNALRTEAFGDTSNFADHDGVPQRQRGHPARHLQAGETDDADKNLQGWRYTKDGKFVALSRNVHLCVGGGSQGWREFANCIVPEYEH